MQLREALELNSRPSDVPPFVALLACGSEPLHLATFLAAHLRLRLPQQPAQVRTGLYDDLAGTLVGVKSPGLDSVFAVMEWPDLDPRLGLRQLGGWSPARIPEIVESARTKLGVLEQALFQAVAVCPVVLSPPLLDLPPLFHSVRQQLHLHAAELQAHMSAFVARAAAHGIKVLNPAQLPPGPRFDIRACLSSGFPYCLDFSSALAEQLVSLVLPPAPKKALITDLDDTLWRGILGDLGADHVSWDLANKTQIHGVYQTLLQSLADAGVLIAVASKNDPGNVQEVLGRSDLLLSPGRIFPVEAGWGPKSEAVARILQAWNIGEDAVVFVDDSPMELAQVARVFPTMTTLRFPTRDAEACWNLFGELRDLFGRPVLSEEDQIRAGSLRDAGVRQRAFETGGGGMDDFLIQSQGVMQVEPIGPADARSLDLVNKTNQFNLNGRRWTEAQWRRMLENGSSVALAISYQDKYGPLGKIGVLAGERSISGLRLHTWVMSCRAFSRRIEHHCLRFLFDEYPVTRIELEYVPTPKNGPLQQFLMEIAEPGQVITEPSFRLRCPPLVHAVRANTTS